MPSYRELLVASYNPKKLEELKELLSDLPMTLLSLNDFPNIAEVMEDGATFKQNAEKKALGYAQQTGCLTLADDSGLSVDFLNGEPGVHSARFSGSEKADLKNCEKVLALLQGVSGQRRTASFKCALALADPKKILSLIEESVSGLIAEEMRGANGFGYDPLFFYPEFGKTFAEVPRELKHAVSHRGKALRRVKEVLSDYLKRAHSSAG